MKNTSYNKFQIIPIIRNIIISLTTAIFLIWAFFKNNIIGKIIISPFIICSISILGESIFLLLNKDKISHIFSYIFRISLFIYIYGFLLYALYYSITTKEYSLIIIIIIFFLFTIPFFKSAFHKKK